MLDAKPSLVCAAVALRCLSDAVDKTKRLGVEVQATPCRDEEQREAPADFACGNSMLP